MESIYGFYLEVILSFVGTDDWDVCGVGDTVNNEGVTEK